MLESRCFCGSKFKNKILLETHQEKCNLSIINKFQNLRLYINSVLHTSENVKKHINTYSFSPSKDLKP